MPKGYNQAIFARQPQANIPRSMFDRSHGLKTTFQEAGLVPIICDEVLPGDTFRLNTSAFIRMSTPIVPFMDEIWVDVHFFYVPYRLLWDNWERFCGAQTDPGDSTDYLMPILENPSSIAVVEHSIHNYLGIPLVSDFEDAYHIMSAMPFRAYYRIWDDWYRDEKFQDSLQPATDDGPDDMQDYEMQVRNKRPDYFTVANPWPQKGDSVPILSDNIRVVGTGEALGIQDTTTNAGLYRNNSGNDLREDVNLAGVTIGTAIGTPSGLTPNVALGVSMDPDYSGLWTSLASSLGSWTSTNTINSLRQAFQIQRMLEKEARGGTRYTEILRAHFGVVSPDFRLQRAEFLGGGRINLNTNPIAQTSSTDGTSPQGNLAGFTVGSAGQIGFNKSFVEHGLIMGLVSVMTELIYQNGINRMWSRRTKYDFYWPTLAHLGEQAILNQEIYIASPTANPQGVFGYQERYAEYRYMPSRVNGYFSSDSATSVDIWHLAQHFTAEPTLGTLFVQQSLWANPVDRLLAVTDPPHFLADFWFDYRCARPMPVYSIPGHADHF